MARRNLYRGLVHPRAPPRGVDPRDQVQSDTLKASDVARALWCCLKKAGTELTNLESSERMLAS
jgi:hypothetical protein